MKILDKQEKENYKDSLQLFNHYNVAIKFSWGSKFGAKISN